MAKNRDRRLYVVDYLITPDQRIDNGAVLCKGDRIVGISDGTIAFGMPNGNYHIGPSNIVVHGGYSQSNGKLAGTTTMLDAGWHSLMSCGHLSENRAALAVTRTPAECSGFRVAGGGCRIHQKKQWFLLMKVQPQDTAGVAGELGRRKYEVQSRCSGCHPLDR